MVVSRRVLLRQAVGAVPGAATVFLAGCALAKSARPTAALLASSAPSAGDLVDIQTSSAFFNSVPQLMEGFNAAQRNVVLKRPVYFVKDPLELEPMPQDFVDQFYPQALPLDVPLRKINFDPSTLLPGSVAAFTRQGHVYFLPITQYPWCVRWRTDAFQAAGLPDPDPRWTLGDFEGTCEELQGLAASGRLSGLHAALGPVFGQYPVRDAKGRLQATFFGAGSAGGGLWQGFAVGFGGSLVQAGRFRLTDPNTLAGLGHLVDMARRFALSPDKVPITVTGMAGFTDRYAMEFMQYDPLAHPGPLHLFEYDARWHYARLPVFPTNPVIPAAFQGQGLVHRPWEGPPPAGSVITRYVNGTAAALLWLYGTEAQRLLMAAGVAPVTADSTAQGAFWSTVDPAARSVGDWQHFVNYAEGWPAVPPATIVAQALEGAVRDPGTLGQQMAQAEQQMNAWMDSQTAVTPSAQA